MENYININGKKIKLSDETLAEIKKHLIKPLKATPSDKVAVCDYSMMSDIDWGKKEEVLIVDEPEKKTFVNQKFADGSKFGEDCVFIKCEFGSYCEFGSFCEFGSCCKFGGSCEFGSYCEFGSACEFGNCCKFGSYCAKQLPYWDEQGKHE